MVVVVVWGKDYSQEYQQQKNFATPEVTSQNRDSPYDKSTKLVRDTYKFTMLPDEKTKYCKGIWRGPVAARIENTEVDHVYTEACQTWHHEPEEQCKMVLGQLIFHMKGEKFSSYLTHMKSVPGGLKPKCNGCNNQTKIQRSIFMSPGQERLS